MHATWNDGDDGWMVLWSSQVFDYCHIRFRQNRSFLFSLLFAALFALFTLVDADLRLTPENVCCCSLFQIRTVVVKSVYMWTLPYYAE